jgi:hypothetical protein
MKEWQPRRPSAGLRSRIFAVESARATALTEQPFDVAALMRWLVPAVGCFVMATATLSHSDSPAVATGVVIGQEMAFAQATRHTSMNNVPATTVEWTFGRASSSNNDSFVRTVTNTFFK